VGGEDGFVSSIPFVKQPHLNLHHVRYRSIGSQTSECNVLSSDIKRQVMTGVAANKKGLGNVSSLSSRGSVWKPGSWAKASSSGLATVGGLIFGRCSPMNPSTFLPAAR